MLGYEYRVTAKWRLFAVITGFGRGEALGDQIGGMLADSVSAFGMKHLPLLRPQVKLSPEGAAAERVEFVIDVLRGFIQSELFILWFRRHLAALFASFIYAGRDRLVAAFEFSFMLVFVQVLGNLLLSFFTVFCHDDCIPD